MRRRHQESLPFGWVFAVLTTLGAIGGVFTGLSAHSIRTASDLPIGQPEPFEQARFVTASVPVPARQEMEPASNSLIEDPALFSPVPAYPLAIAPAPVAAEPVETAAPAPQPVAPPPAATKPNAQATAAPARHASSRPGGVLNDAQIASIKKRLNLTPDQEALWPAVEAALRNISYSRKAQETKVASLGNGAGRGPMAYVDTNSAEVQQLKYAALPLIMRLNDDQKREVRSMAYVMGLESVASSF
jgi:hypothetical protein